MKTTIVKVTWTHELLAGHGWGNGYVLIPNGHPLHGKDYDQIDVRVHGGLTYAALVTEDIIKRMNLDPEDKGSWIVGFDTLHYGDTAEYWTEKRVAAETRKLRKQLMNYKE